MPAYPVANGTPLNTDAALSLLMGHALIGPETAMRIRPFLIFGEGHERSVRESLIRVTNAVENMDLDAARYWMGVTFTAMERAEERRAQ